MIQVLETLGIVSIACPKYTNSWFRRAVELEPWEKSRCARWKINCYLESDGICFRGSEQRLMCAFCKTTHPPKAFGMLSTDVGYGIECLQLLLGASLITRYCWLHVPKRINYSPTFRDPEQEKWARSLPEDRWIVIVDLVCLHCGDRVLKDQKTGEYSSCPTCTQKCDICGYVEMYNFNRYGRERPLQSYKKIQFVKRRETDYMIEVEDRNGIHMAPKGFGYSKHSLLEYAEELGWRG